MRLHLRIATALAACLLLPGLASAALNPGDIVFTLFDADDNEFNEEGDDQFAFVALVDIPGEEEIFFSDQQWNNNEADTFVGFEGTMAWTAPIDGVSAGTLVSFTTANELIASVGDISEGSNHLFLSPSGETLWAYQGVLDTPSGFLSSISTENFDDTLDGTSLTEGVNAISLATSNTHAQYIGPRVGEDSLGDYLALVAGDVATNWFQQNSSSGVDFLADTMDFYIGLPGDFNEDLIVDAADYALWRNSLGQDEVVLNGGGDGLDGVDIKDYDLWRKLYGSSTAPIPSPVALAQPAPEPGGAMLFSGVITLLAARRKTRSH